MLTAPLSVDNKTIYSADGYCFKEWYWMCCWHSWGLLRLFLLHSQLTDKSSLKFICWKECRFVRPQSCTHERRDAMQGLINWGICHLRLAVAGKQIKKAWRNLTAGRLASLPPPPVLLSSVVEGISMTGAYSPGSISILLYLSWFPVLLLQIAMKKVLKHMLSRLLRCISISVWMCAPVFHATVCITVAIFVYLCVLVCVCVCPLGDAV